MECFCASLMTSLPMMVSVIICHNLFLFFPPLSLATTNFLGFVASLRINSLDAPIAIPRGQPVLLFCNYDLDGDELYSVKFYKDFVEFYRYLPSESEPGQKFLLKGAYVDVSEWLCNVSPSANARPKMCDACFSPPIKTCSC